MIVARPQVPLTLEQLPSARDRLDGYQLALREAGIYDERLVEAASDWGLESGRAALARLLSRGAGFTGVFVHSDLLALGAIRELRVRDLSVPEDISVVGYDDIPVAELRRSAADHCAATDARGRRARREGPPRPDLGRRSRAGRRSHSPAHDGGRARERRPAPVDR